LDIKSRNYSHGKFTKVMVFIITILCFTGAITVFLNIMILGNGDFAITFEKSYYHSEKFINDSSRIVSLLTTLLEYKSEENILAGNTISEEEIQREKNILYEKFIGNYWEGYNPELNHEQNYQKFEEIYGDNIERVKERLIAEDLEIFNSALRRIGEYKGIYYFGKNGENQFTNSPNIDKSFFKTHPSYLIFDKEEEGVYPAEIRDNSYYHRINWPQGNNISKTETALYIAYTDEFLKPRMEEWENKKEIATDYFYKLMGFLAGFIIAFIYLIIIIGRRFFGEKKVHLNVVDKLYNDVNAAMCFSLIFLWFVLMDNLVFRNKYLQGIFPITLLIGTLGLILVLSLVKHIKNGTFIKHTIIFTLFAKFFKFLKEIYDSGSIGIKIAVVVVGYPLLVALTFFIFPITIGIALWLALKKVKEYQAIKEGLARVKEGDLQHKIEIKGTGELAKLAADINSITDGLKNAVANELKSERLKTELITNVSHDIRTPLTSIITYVDLLKNEEDQRKMEEYIEIIEQKAQRLKILTDDLFEASKASSGNMPVNLEKIDIVSLITQGLGEVNDKIQERGLEFRVNYPKEKVLVTADGKLLWRAIENLLSNIFKYALTGSRVYVDVENLGNRVKLVMKNISAYELNISAEELMERFKRGDESRSSQGSGLGLSIAKSLVEIQNGSFDIEIDGDLFKAVIQIPSAM